MVDLFLSGGKTRRGFCEENGIKPPTFNYWLKRVRDHRMEPSGGFARVVLGNPPVGSRDLEVTFPNGVMVKVPATDLPLVSALIRLY